MTQPRRPPGRSLAGRDAEGAPPTRRLTMTERSLEADLAASGKVIDLYATGRRSGLARRVTVGFVEDGHGALLVSAASSSTGWAVNLRDDPRCRVELQGQVRSFTATELAEAERASAITRLILKYGTPAERLGAGPAFRLEPVG